MKKIVAFLLAFISCMISSYGQQIEVVARPDSVALGQSLTLAYRFSNMDKSTDTIVLDLGRFQNNTYAQDTSLLEQWADIEINGVTCKTPFKIDGKKVFFTGFTPNFTADIAIFIFSFGEFQPSKPLLLPEKAISFTANPFFVSAPIGLKNNKNPDINDLSPIYQTYPSIEELLPFLALLLLGLIGWFWYKKRKQKQVASAPVKTYDPYENAIESLDKLKAEQPWTHGDIKGYQSRLTGIIRQFIEETLQVKAIEQTSFETINDLEQQQLPTSQIQNVQEILTIADLVKFAKAEPTNETHEAFLTKAYDFVNHIKNHRTDHVG